MCYGAYRAQFITKASHLWGWMPIFLFTLVFGLRYGVGIDYNSYLEIYEYSEGYSFSELLENERFEPGFLLLVYICHTLNAPVYVFFSIFAFLQILLIYLTFKNEDNILIYIYLTLICTGVCMLSFMNIMRQMVAFGIFLFSLKYICDNKLLKYWICCLLAIAFHKSAIILFPLYFIWIRKKGILNIPLVEIVIMFLSLCSVYLASWQGLLHRFDNLTVLLGYEGYIDQADNMIEGGGRGLGFYDIFEFLVYSIIVLNSVKMKEYFQSKLFNIIYDLFFVGVCLGYLFSGSMLLDRIIVYFTHTQFIIIAYSLSYLYKTKKQTIAQFINYCILVLFIFMQYGRFTYYCEQNTGAYVSYFQTDLHTLKDNLREETIEKHN
jgi:hypothetical protein